MKIHIFGASGSGVSSLGRALSRELEIKVFDSDDYYWKKTNPPFQEAYPVNEREQRLANDLSDYPSWIVSGTLVSWGELIKDQFDLAVYLYVPRDERLKRLKRRELKKFGNRILEGGDMFDAHQKFLKWASQYDEGEMSGRSKKRHESWIKKLKCPFYKIEGVVAVEDSVFRIRQFLNDKRT